MILTLLAITCAMVLALLIAVIYLNDRVRDLEKKHGGSLATEGWGGLTGKVLWDAMAGKSAAGVATGTVAFLRADYELILSKHIEGLFRDGFQDGRSNQTRQVSPLRSITSTRGSVQSWIPPKSAAALYRAGIDAARADLYQAETVRMTIDEITGDLFAEVGLRLNEPFSRDLMPQEPEPAVAPDLPPASSAAPPAGASEPPPNPAVSSPAAATGLDAAPAAVTPAKAEAAMDRFEAAVHAGRPGI